jgi:hypothetical protein
MKRNPIGPLMVATETRRGLSWIACTAPPVKAVPLLVSGKLYGYIEADQKISLRAIGTWELGVLSVIASAAQEGFASSLAMGQTYRGFPRRKTIN